MCFGEGEITLAVDQSQFWVDLGHLRHQLQEECGKELVLEVAHLGQDPGTWYMTEM